MASTPYLSYQKPLIRFDIKKPSQKIDKSKTAWANSIRSFFSTALAGLAWRDVEKARQIQPFQKIREHQNPPEDSCPPQGEFN